MDGRLGQTDNSQVGVFAAAVRDRVAALVYVPEEWFAAPARCQEAGIPEGMEFCTKGSKALRMIHRLRREALRFAYTVFDAGYGHLPRLLRALDGEGETFLAFEDAKAACGMADYQVRDWPASHHHMALVMVALMFLAKDCAYKNKLLDDFNSYNLKQWHVGISRNRSNIADRRDDSQAIQPR